MAQVQLALLRVELLDKSQRVTSLYIRELQGVCYIKTSGWIVSSQTRVFCGAYPLITLSHICYLINYMVQQNTI
jgi:hypothetical protein